MKTDIIKNIPPLDLNWIMLGFNGGCGFGKCKWSLFEKWFKDDLPAMPINYN